MKLLTTLFLLVPGILYSQDNYFQLTGPVSELRFDLNQGAFQWFKDLPGEATLNLHKGKADFTYMGKTTFLTETKAYQPTKQENRNILAMLERDYVDSEGNEYSVYMVRDIFNRTWMARLTSGGAGFFIVCSEDPYRTESTIAP